MTTKPVFIVGMPRSGTTLVQSILGTSDRIGTLQETHLFNLGSKIFKPKPTLWDILISNYRTNLQCYRLGIKLFFYKNFKQFILGFNNSISQKFNKISYYVEKTPSHLYYVDFIRETLPKSKFIFVRRDFGGNVNSYQKLNYKWRKNLIEQKLVSAEIRWIKDNYLIIKHFNSNDSLIVDYDILTNPTQTNKVVSKIEKFLEVSLSTDKNSLMKSAKKIITQKEDWKKNNLTKGIVNNKSKKYLEEKKIVRINLKEIIKLLGK